MNYAKILALIFTLLTFVGATYVLLNKGQVSAGYAVVPMVLAILTLAFDRR